MRTPEIHRADDREPMTTEPPCVKVAMTGGLSPGAKLRENQIFELSLTGVEFAGEMTFEQWFEAMSLLRMWDGAGKLWLADFFLKGREAFGQEQVEQAMMQLEFTIMDTERALAIASLPRGIRNPKLTTEHYWVLAQARLDATAQAYWAKAVLEHSLSARLLQESIAAGKVIVAPPGRNGGVATVQAFRQTFDRWFKQVDKSDPIAEWDESRKRQLWEELEAPTRLGIQLARALGVNLPESGVGR